MADLSHIFGDQNYSAGPINLNECAFEDDGTLIDEGNPHIPTEPSGDSGSQGVQGVQGTQGIQGIAGSGSGGGGIQGSQGIQGMQGIAGEGGVGIQGLQGVQGIIGEQGIQGSIGIQGSYGLQGIAGETGLQGIIGEAGLQGIGGIQGAVGIQGIKGEQAVYQDFNTKISLHSDTDMSDLLNGVAYNNANVLFDIYDTLTINVDTSASNENYFILSNEADNNITVTFDYSTYNDIRFIGDDGYSSYNSIVIPIQKGLTVLFTFNMIGNNVIVYSVKKVQSHVTLVDESELSSDAVALVFKNTTTNELKFLDIDTIGENSLNIQGCVLQDYVRFTRGKNGVPVVIHKTAMSKYIYAEYNRYKLYCDTTDAGGFHWKVSINGTNVQGDVTWAADDTLDSIVTQMAAQIPSSASNNLNITHDNNTDFIKVRKGGKTNSTFTLTNNTGAALVDLSLYTMIGGVQQAETHRDWQARSVNTLFPNANFPAANTKYYCKNGYDMSQRTGVNYPKYEAYWENNTSGNTWYPENSTSKRMSRNYFASLDGSGNAEKQALFDKYNGSWDRYMDAAMNVKDDTHTDGIDYTSYDNGDVCTAFLASVETMDFNGSYIHAYPAAYHTTELTDQLLGTYQMPTVHEMAVFMDNDIMQKINTAFTYLTDYTSLIVTTNYWAVADYDETSAWFYNGQRGEAGYNERFQNANNGRYVAYIHQ